MLTQTSIHHKEFKEYSILKWVNSHNIYEHFLGNILQGKKTYYYYNNSHWRSVIYDTLYAKMNRGREQLQ